MALIWVLEEAKKAIPGESLLDNVQPRRLNSVAYKSRIWRRNGDGSSLTFFVIVAIRLFNLEGGIKDGTL
jgi:hypothetical protein